MVEFLFTRLELQYDECESLFELLSQLSQEISAVDANDQCTLKVIRSILEERLSQDIQAGSFFSGSITFCSMMPMRNVPAKFIALIGMRDDAYPRQDLKTEFSQFPDGIRIGDRSRREDDRYLFLESILAARDHLYISYTGIDSQTLNEEPASIVVEELLDTLDEYYQFPGDSSARETLVRKESLQAFSPINFVGDPPRSFSAEDLDAAIALTGSKSGVTGLEIATVSTKPEQSEPISLERFIRLFLNPCQYWLSNQLETNYPYQARTLDDTEPIQSNSLQDFQWGTLLLDDPQKLSGKTDYLLDSLLPVGSLKEATYERIAPQVTAILNRWNEIPTDGNLHRVAIDQRLEWIQLTGSIEGVFGSSLKRMRFGNVRSIDLLTNWIHHLALCAIADNNDFRTHLLGKKETYSFFSPDSPRDHLTQLERYFLNGHTSALPFFVDTAFSFAKATLHPSPNAKKAPIDIAYTVFTKLVEYPFSSSRGGLQPVQPDLFSRSGYRLV